MVAGFHLIWTAYGWWLPNDPRGSSSHEIRVERIADLGDSTTVARPCSRHLAKYGLSMSKPDTF